MKNWVFGYGSLVNEKTWPKKENGAEAFAFVELAGWRREWRHAVDIPGGRISALTIAPAPAATIHGIITEVMPEDFHDLDKREIGYDRFIIRDGLRMVKEGGGYSDGDTVYAYRSRDAHVAWADTATPILQSYVDCIMDGFYRHFGEAGAIDFVTTTHGWGPALTNDRAAPRYPRALQLEADFLAKIDGWLAAHGRTKDGHA